MAKKPTTAKELPKEIADIPATFAEGVATIEADNDLNPVAGPAPTGVDPSVAPQVPSPKVMVVYNFVRNDGTGGTSRLFLQGLYDIRSQAEIEQVEKLVIEQSKGQFVGVIITGWKALEA